MNVFTVFGIVGIGVAIFTVILSGIMYTLSRAVAANYAEIEREQTKYKPAVTMGYQIAPSDEATAQFKQARVEAARLAAAKPRGGNMGIGRAGQANLQTASQNLTRDPISAFKIAQVQGWSGLGQFDQLQAAATATVGAPVAAAAPQVKRQLVAGKDYPVTEITADMSPADKRQARIANAKAKSAAYKALKESGHDMVAAPVSTAAPTPAATPAPSAAATAAAAGIAEPTLIEITEGMDPAEVRKARIANAKAMSAYKKALKAAGIDPSTVEI